MVFVRGDIYRLAAPKDAMGHEQDGARFAIDMQGDDILLSTKIVCPTSRSAPARSWRPEITILGQPTRVLTEQISAVAPERLGQYVDRLALTDVLNIEQALRIVLGFLK